MLPDDRCGCGCGDCVVWPGLPGAGLFLPDKLLRKATFAWTSDMPREPLRRELKMSVGVEGEVGIVC